MYMIYKLNEFRAKTREAFNIAENGGEVLIDRYGVMFELRRLPFTTSGDIKSPISLQDEINKNIKYMGIEPVVTEPEETA